MDPPRPLIPNHPKEILLLLDQHLDHEVPLILFGRAALSLGFENAPDAFQMTQDVDAIITLSHLPDLTNDFIFWDAIEHTNNQLAHKGLYITHLFCEDQVFLRPDWEQHLVPINHPPTRFLRLSRPHVIDLILTKMMRGNDELDMADIRFLVSQAPVTLPEMEAAFASVRIPEVPELHEAFKRSLPIVREILESNRL
ncbi:MAG: hypothetical protein MUF31_18730 [Akkermansiaceae bacterium]|jgi:hypothetical protein|nr:hypothetical protein [Akkermansiaceae bacterium]